MIRQLHNQNSGRPWRLFPDRIRMPIFSVLIIHWLRCNYNEIATYHNYISSNSLLCDWLKFYHDLIQLDHDISQLDRDQWVEFWHKRPIIVPTFLAWHMPWLNFDSSASPPTDFIAQAITCTFNSNLSIIGPDIGISPGRRQAIIWTNAGILLIGPWGTNFSEILIGIHTFSFKKIYLKMSSAKWRPFCLSLNVLTHWGRVTHICISKRIIIGSDNGLSPDHCRQAIIWTNAPLLLTGPLRKKLQWNRKFTCFHSRKWINKKLQQTTKNTFGPGTHFPDDQSIRI